MMFRLGDFAIRALKKAIKAIGRILGIAVGCLVLIGIGIVLALCTIVGLLILVIL